MKRTLSISTLLLLVLVALLPVAFAHGGVAPTNTISKQTDIASYVPLIAALPAHVSGRIAGSVCG